LVPGAANEVVAVGLDAAEIWLGDKGS
jgi:hypothetical protein